MAYLSLEDRRRVQESFQKLGIHHRGLIEKILTDDDYEPLRVLVRPVVDRRGSGSGRQGSSKRDLRVFRFTDELEPSLVFDLVGWDAVMRETRRAEVTLRTGVSTDVGYRLKYGPHVFSVKMRPRLHDQDVVVDNSEGCLPRAIRNPRVTEFYDRQPLDRAQRTAVAARRHESFAP